MSSQELEQLWSRGKEFLGTKYAIMGGAMSWVSDYNLVAASSNAGIFGVIATGSMNCDMLREQIVKTRENTKNPFGVNLIVMHPDLEALVGVCIEEKVSHVIFAGGLPLGSTIARCKENNIKTIVFLPSVNFAKRFIKQGVDAFIIEGSEAGGHIGSVSTSVLVQEILLEVKEQLVFVAGGVGSGDIMASLLKLGASGVQIGTILVCAEECKAHPNFKQAFIRAKSRDAQVTQQLDPEFPVIPVRAINNKGSKEFISFQQSVINEYKEGLLDKKEAMLKIEHYWAGSLRKAVVDGDVEYGSLMAGQIVGLITKEEPLKDIIENLVETAIKSL